jgi:hypothetical protein
MSDHAPIPPTDSEEWVQRQEMAKVFAAMRHGEDTICPDCLCCDTDWSSCDQCGGEGYVDRYDEDPLWYGHELYECDFCCGKGGWKSCLGNCDRVAVPAGSSDLGEGKPK